MKSARKRKKPPFSVLINDIYARTITRKILFPQLSDLRTEITKKKVNLSKTTRSNWEAELFVSFSRILSPFVVFFTKVLQNLHCNENSRMSDFRYRSVIWVNIIYLLLCELKNIHWPFLSSIILNTKYVYKNAVITKLKLHFYW